MATTIRQIKKVELHQHVDGSIPPRTIWRLMHGHGLSPVPTFRAMQRLLQLQADAEGSLLTYLDKCVVGFDLAGAERGNPPRLFRDAYDIARRGGLGFTVHAGEDEGPERIWEAIGLLGTDQTRENRLATRRDRGEETSWQA